MNTEIAPISCVSNVQHFLNHQCQRLKLPKNIANKTWCGSPLIGKNNF